jgi:hypothetical protein
MYGYDGICGEEEAEKGNGKGTTSSVFGYAGATFP